MPLPSGTIPLAPGERNAPPAFLVRFPEDTWTKLADAAAHGDEISFTVNDGMSLDISGHDPIPLEALGSSQASELFTYTDNHLVPVGIAAGRLSVPFTVGATSLAAEKVRQQSEALDRQRAQRAERVTGKPTAQVASHARPVDTIQFRASPAPSHQPAPMLRSQSGPAASMLGTERIPLKTLVVQFLALGPASLDEIVAGTNGDLNDVVRTVKVIAVTQQIDGLPKWALRPQQYAKIKVGGWAPYSYDDKVRVIMLARKAFDELDLPPDAEERDALSKKEEEALAGGPPAVPTIPAPILASTSTPSPPGPAPLPSSAPAKPSSPRKRNSVSPIKLASTSSLPPSRAESPAGNGKKKDKVERTKVGKQIARMRTEIAKRASSLPNSRTDGTASPRIQDEPMEDVEKPDPKAKAKPPPKGDKKRKLEGGKERRVSRDYTSSESSEDERGRDRKPKAVNGTARSKEPLKEPIKLKSSNGNGAAARRRPSPAYTSSDDERPKRRRSDESVPERTLPSFKRKAAAPETNGHRKSTPEVRDRDRDRDRERDRDRDQGRDRERDRRETKRERDPSPRSPKVDARALRERYDELYPKYMELSDTLAATLRAAERIRDGGTPEPLASESEVSSMVAQYEDWHKEMEKIRAWFA